MKWARVHDDVAVEVIDFDPTGRFSADLVWTEVADDCLSGSHWDGSAWMGAPTPAPTPEPGPYVPIVPQSITMRQARLVLLGAGYLDAVDAAVNAMTGTAGKAAQIEWNFSKEVWRNKALVLSLAPALGLTSDQVDALFIAGSQIE